MLDKLKMKIPPSSPLISTVYSPIFVKNYQRNHPGRAKRTSRGLLLDRDKNNKSAFRIYYQGIVDYKTTSGRCWEK